MFVRRCVIFVMVELAWWSLMVVLQITGAAVVVIIWTCNEPQRKRLINSLIVKAGHLLLTTRDSSRPAVWLKAGGYGGAYPDQINIATHNSIIAPSGKTYRALQKFTSLLELWLSYASFCSLYPSSSSLKLVDSSTRATFHGDCQGLSRQPCVSLSSRSYRSTVPTLYWLLAQILQVSFSSILVNIVELVCDGLFVAKSVNDRYK